MVSIHILMFSLPHVIECCSYVLQCLRYWHRCPKIFLYLISQYGWHHPIHGNVTESAAKLERNCATWWLPSTLWSQDVCMPIDVQAWVVHLIVYGIDTWGVNNYENSVFQEKWFWFQLFNRKKSGYEIDTLFFQITKMLLKCITLFFFLNTCFLIRILSS